MGSGQKVPGGNLYVALLHNPVYDKQGHVVTTCITNLDLHDIARVARTYHLGQFFVVHPVPSQAALARRIVHHWKEGFGASYNATRKEAFELMTLCGTLKEATDWIRKEKGGKSPRIVITAAGRFQSTIGFAELSTRIHEGEEPYLLLFGTGWGLVEDVIKEADDVLEPIQGVGDYNHLSVRSAVSIVIDRLMGDRQVHRTGTTENMFQ
ncbi:MAG: RNA methyltransferase [bacterium]